MESICQWSEPTLYTLEGHTLCCMLTRDTVQYQMNLGMTEIALVTNMQYVMSLKGHAVNSGLVPVPSPQVCAQSGYLLSLNKYSQTASSLFVLLCSPFTYFQISSCDHACQFLHWTCRKQTHQKKKKKKLTLFFFLKVQNSVPLFLVAMDKAWRVEFRNVGCSYFPQSRVDCHYTLRSGHNWASNDWIGLFKVLLTWWLSQIREDIYLCVCVCSAAR